MTNIILSGCNGKMGRTVARLAKSDEHSHIVAGIDVVNEEQDYFPIFTHPSLCDIKGHVIIDFSRPSALDHIIALGKKNNAGIVVATTGLDPHHQTQLLEASKEIPILLSSNMSLGVNLLLELVQKAAHVLSLQYDIEIIEKHHNAKVDSPSGTAFMIADAINAVLKEKKDYVFERASSQKKREPKELGMISMRGGTIVGEHEVIFAGPDEIIEITHKAYSRDIFARGALNAAQFLKDKKPGMYSMNDLIKQ
jgi:4-hydroxy-tetrahydrodipicolinate reductase